MKVKKDLVKNVVIGILVVLTIGLAGSSSNSPSNNSVTNFSQNNIVSQFSNSSENTIQIELDGMKVRVAQCEAKIVELENKNSELTTQKQQLEEQLNVANSSKSELESQVSSLIAQNQELQDKVQTSASVASQTSTPVTQSQVTNSYTVYVTKTGEKYHRESCSYLRQSKIAMDKGDAIAQGYTACSRCNP